MSSKIWDGEMIPFREDGLTSTKRKYEWVEEVDNKVVLYHSTCCSTASSVHSSEDVGDCFSSPIPILKLIESFISTSSFSIFNSTLLLLAAAAAAAAANARATMVDKGGGVGAPGCWVSTWRLRSTLRWNAFSQSAHEKGLYPVCLRMCVIRFDDWLNALPQITHLCGFSPGNPFKCWFE